MYFTKFHRVFPIVHAPTFRPSSKSSLLLLSLCSLGSLFVGSSHAASQGLKVFETLNKAILSSVRQISNHFWATTNFMQWERHFSSQGPETIAMVQAALIGQTFGLLSGVSQLKGCILRTSKLTGPEAERLADCGDFSRYFGCCR